MPSTASQVQLPAVHRDAPPPPDARHEAAGEMTDDDLDAVVGGLVRIYAPGPGEPSYR